MMETIKLITPQWIPPLDEGFRPAALANRAFAQLAAQAGGEPLVIGLERENGELSRFETRVLPAGHPEAGSNLPYVERLVKFLLWQRGGYKLFIGGPTPIADYIRQAYAPDGPRAFEYHFMGEQVYEQPFSVIACSADEAPARHEASRPMGRHLDGCRIGFDLGASDHKVSAMVDGQVVFSAEKVWEPRKQADPDYHFNEIITALKAAAAHMPRMDAIGGSSAGIIIANRPMVASLFRGIPVERFSEVKNLFARIQAEMGVPVEVINDGDVAALAGSMSLEENGVLGLAMGSSEAAGFVDLEGHIIGWLNELAFAPIDYSLTAPKDEWSGDRGVGSQYFSQQCVFRLAPRAGIRIPTNLPDAGRLKYVQGLLESGHEGALKIWQSMGIFLGYGLAHYADFYDFRHVLILGRCTSGEGGSLILDGANAVLQSEFPELAARIQIQLPDEKSRRVGQAIAAASLPELKR
jgi:predicted NBD/HSP70 family sugar kinase